ncbi:MAG: hypothetical protein JXR37_00485 [Kiritimatiellae bacterium]|nr:hypothetical protein [Kiritimatiellia bacterium]
MFTPCDFWVFRSFYPKGADRLVCPHVKDPSVIRRKNLRVAVCGLQHYEVRQSAPCT